ncbi:MAG: restriction endonuclease subunit S [Spirochaetaceae bacterium]|nr:restriction endonuclease subunit S [Spirochaetaceae bacterium]
MNKTEEYTTHGLTKMDTDKKKLPEGWEWKKLEEVCEEIFAGGDVPKNNYSKNKTDEYNIPIFANGEKNKGLHGYTNKARVKKPSITVSARGTIGYTEIRHEDYYPAVRLITIVPGKIIQLAFLYHAIRTLTILHNGTSIPQLTVPMIKDYEIPLPPLAEQKRIVAILDEAFAAIDTAKANAEKKLANAEKLFESYLNGIFTNPGEDWEKKKLGEVCKEIFAGGDAPKKTYSQEKNEKYNIPIYANAAKDNGLYGYTDIARVLEPSITVAARGSGTGHTEIRLIPFLPIVRLIVLIPNTELVDLTFLKFIVDRLTILKSGSAIPQLTVPMIRDYFVSFPKLSDQKRIVAELDALNAETKQLESIYQQKIAALDELKKSILKKAFEGEL